MHLYLPDEPIYVVEGEPSNIKTAIFSHEIVFMIFVLLVES